MSEIVIIEDSDEEALDKQTGQHSKRGQAHELSEIERDKVRGTEQENQLLSEPVTVKRSFPEEIDSAEKAGSSKRQVLQNLRIPSFSGANEQDIVDLESLEHRRESNHQASDSNSGDQAWIAPFQLFRAQGIPDYANRMPTGLRLRDVVCGKMKWVLVSNYMVDMGWLLSACPDLKQADFVQLVHGESHPTMVKLMKEEAKLVGLLEGKNFAINAPPLPIPYGTHHSKAFIIEYETGMRLIVHTANLVHCDNAFKTQGLWFQDFPRKDSASPIRSELEDDLLDYIRALQIPSANQPQMSIIARIKQYDFSSARVHLIASRPGRHTGMKVGHLALRGRLGPEVFDAEFERAPCFAQFSSLGSLDAKWLHQEFQQTLSTGYSRANGRSKVPLGSNSPDQNGLKIIWPTVDEVQNSLEGWAAGRSIPGFEKNVKKSFLQKLWHRFGGEPMSRQRAMPHIKTYGRYVHIPGKGTKLAWFCLASHNLSKAAWGSLSAGHILMVRSYELGVLFLPRLEQAYRRHRHCGFSCTQPPPIPLPQGTQEEVEIEFWAKIDPSPPRDQASKMYFPLPYKLPPKHYEAGDRPWMADYPFPGLDAYGKRRDDDFPPIYGFTES